MFALDLKMKVAVVIKVLFFPDTIVRVHDDTRTTSYSSTCITWFDSLVNGLYHIRVIETDPDHPVTSLSSMCYDHWRLVY